MKKFLFLFSAVAFLLVSCGDKDKKEEGGGGMSDNAKKNLEISRTVTKAFETGDISKIDSVIAADFVDHTPKGDIGRDSLKYMITEMNKNASGLKMEIMNEVADENYAYSWIRVTGTNTGDKDMPKGPFDMTAVEVVKCKDGKAIEHWEFMEAREMMKMMPPPPPPAKDTANK